MSSTQLAQGNRRGSFDRSGPGSMGSHAGWCGGEGRSVADISRFAASRWDFAVKFAAGVL